MRYNPSVWCGLILIVAGPASAALTQAGSAPSQKFVDLPAAEQAAILGDIVGHGCMVSTASLEGLKPDGSARWFVGCVNGQRYELEINSDGVKDGLDAGRDEWITPLHATGSPNLIK
jgi:hypothetical protein